MEASALLQRRRSEAVERLRIARWPILQAALAAGMAWYIAHNLLHHAQPFFAPIAAAVSLGAIAGQRGRRALQMILGVCTGIAIGEIFHSLLGTDAVSIGIVTLVTLNVAIGLGWGFVGQGMMFVNQAASSAIIVITLRRAGTGTERILDALVGGGVALVISQVLFPPDPLKVLSRAEHRALTALAGSFDELVRMLEQGHRVDADWMLRRTDHIHRVLDALRDARAAAREISRLTRRRASRGAVAAEDLRASHLSLLGNDLLSLLRIALGRISVGDEGALPTSTTESIELLAEAVHRLGSTDERALTLAERAAVAIALTTPSSPREGMVSQLVLAIVRDVKRIAGDRSFVSAPPVTAG